MRKYELELRAVDGLGLSEVEMDLLVTLVNDFVQGHRGRGAREGGGRAGQRRVGGPVVGGHGPPRRPVLRRGALPHRRPGRARWRARSCRPPPTRALLRVRPGPAARRGRRCWSSSAASCPVPSTGLPASAPTTSTAASHHRW
jgi:hypothetical protein